MNKINLILENLKYSSKIELLEESSNIQSQMKYEMTQLFITETTVVLDVLLEEAHNSFRQKFEIFLENQIEDADETGITAEDVVGAASVGALGLGAVSKYRPLKFLAKTMMRDVSRSGTMKGFRAINKDSRIVGSHIKNGALATKNYVMEKYNNYKSRS